MANAFKCDICGTYGDKDKFVKFDVYRSVYLGESESDPGIEIWLSVGKGRNRYAHLCQSCHEEIEPSLQAEAIEYMDSLQKSLDNQVQELS